METVETKSPHKLYPVFINLEQLQTLVVGAGSNGLENLQSLLSNSADADLTIVTPFVSEEMQDVFSRYPRVKLIRRSFQEGDLHGKDLVILATNDPDLDKQIKDLAASKEKNKIIDTEGRWKKIAMISLAAFALMLLGQVTYFYFPFSEVFDNPGSWIDAFDKSFFIMLLAGFLAQLVDGALGMGYGVTSASILLSAGVNPAAISSSIHTAEMFASGASGYSHFKLGNVNIKLFKALVIPGVLGAVAGAGLLVFAGEQYGSYIRPVIAVYTLLLGVRFIMNAFKESKVRKKFKHYRLLAGVGGFFDSFAGGGWGPIVTSTLINNGRSHKYVIGSVSLTEFFVTLSSAFTFFTLIGTSHWQTILGLILGGFIAAPFAARLTGKLSRKVSYALLGTLVIIWSIRILVNLL